MPRILRKVMSRVQDFRSTEEYPDGFLREVLECGHVHFEAVEKDPPATDNGRPFPHGNPTAKKRRCRECEKTRKR